jgi:hypothetical protein
VETTFARVIAKRTLHVTSRPALVVAIAVVLVTCIAPVETLPLDVGIETNKPTAASGDTINFLVSAQGNNLIGIETDFADGTSDSFATGGARTAHVTFRHAYAVPGTYDVRATVTDATAGQKAANVQVQVH